jgi:hypothetical protein
METITTITSILIASLFFIAGFFKLLKSKNIQQVNTASTALVPTKFIAVSEMILSILFIVPFEMGFLPVISHVSALGLTVLMMGAPITHIKMGEHAEASLTTLLLIVMLVVTFTRIFG